MKKQTVTSKFTRSTGGGADKAFEVPPAKVSGKRLAGGGPEEAPTAKKKVRMPEIALGMELPPVSKVKPVVKPVAKAVVKAKKKLAIEKDPDGGIGSVPMPQGPSGRTK